MVVDLVRLDDDTDLAPRRHREDPTDTGVLGDEGLELPHALDVLLDLLPARTGTGGGHGVGRLDDDGLDGRGGHLVVVRGDGVDDGLGLAAPSHEVGPEGRVRALHLGREGLAEVVEEGTPAGDVDVGADLGGDRRGDLCALDEVLEDVLPVRGPQAQPAEHPDELLREPLDAGALGGVVAGGEVAVVRPGEGVGTVTRPGLPVPPGEPAINPVPRRMIAAALAEVSASCGVDGECAGDIDVTVGVTGGAGLSERTWNPRLGILGGLSILGTTGIVVPYSCAAWIHAIHRGIDVARAAGLDHVAGATGNASEAAAKLRYALPDIALLDMGDFAGGMLKYLRTHPVPRLTIAGGFAKLAKLAHGALALHSSRSEIDRAFLADLAREAGGSAALAGRIMAANTAAEALSLASRDGVPLASAVAERARESARSVLRDAPILVNVLVVDRAGAPLAETGHG